MSTPAPPDVSDAAPATPSAAAATPSAALDLSSLSAATPAPNPATEVFRTLFVYGPLMAEEVVTKLLGRVPRSRPAKLPGYLRCCKKGAQSAPDGVCTTHRGLIANCYPAIVGTGVQGHEVEGIIYERLRPKEIRCLDYYEDPSYQKVPVTVVAENGFGGQQTIDALVYTWPASPQAVKALDLDRPWQYTDFRRRHMQDFLDSVVAKCKERFEKEEGVLEVILTDRTDRGQPMSHRGAAPQRPG